MLPSEPDASQEKRSVLITGASRGLGCLIAARLAASGWRVIATMRDPSSRRVLDDAIAGAGADLADVNAIELDVLDRDRIAYALTRAVSESGSRLDAIVANAGVAVLGAFEDVPMEETRRVMETNYFGTIETVRAALPSLRSTRGRIVLISSDSGLCGAPGLSAYTASKFALEGWAESLAYETEPLGVSVSLIEPGPFSTDIWSSNAYLNPGGPYAELGRIVKSDFDRTGRESPAPTPVLDAVVRALTSERPRLRYPVGRSARLTSILKRLMPDRVFGSIVRWTTGLRSWHPKV